MPSEFSWLGYDALSRKLLRLADPDATPLMEQWEKIIVEDNRKGVLEGYDMDDKPYPELKYRAGHGQVTRGRKGKSHGTVVKGAHSPGVGGNLTTAEYRQLTGPRLAPRGEGSRVITNLMSGHGRDTGDRFRWFALGKWFDVVNAKGEEFLHYHFDGMGRNPRYDLRGVRAWGQRQAREALRQWVAKLLGSQ